MSPPATVPGFRTAGQALHSALSARAPGSAEIAAVVRHMDAHALSYAAAGDHVVVRYREGWGVVDAPGARRMLERNRAGNFDRLAELEAAVAQAEGSAR